MWGPRHTHELGILEHSSNIKDSGAHSMAQGVSRQDREQEVRQSAAKANAFSEHWCIMHILLFPLCRILRGFPGKQGKKCTTWISWACRSAANVLYGWAEHTEQDVPRAGWNPRQMCDGPNSHSHHPDSEIQGLAEETWGNVNFPHLFAFFFPYLEILWRAKTPVLKDF